MTSTRRSASDALKGAQVADTASTEETKVEATQVEGTASEEAAKATPEVDAHGSDVEGKVDSPEAAAQDVDQATPGDFAAGSDEDEEDEDWDITVAVIVTHDAFNYFEDGVHMTAKKGDRIDLEEYQVERAVNLGAVRKAGKD